MDGLDCEEMAQGCNELKIFILIFFQASPLESVSGINS